MACKSNVALRFLSTFYACSDFVLSELGFMAMIRECTFYAHALVYSIASYGPTGQLLDYLDIQLFWDLHAAYIFSRIKSFSPWN